MGRASPHDVRSFAIAAGRLSDALIALSEQAGISIAIGDPRLDALQTRGLRGRYTAPDALARLLEGSGYGFTFVDARTVRLKRQPPPLPPPPPRPAPPRAPAPPPAPVTGPDIVVSATKQRLGLASYPGSISVITPGRITLARAGSEGTRFLLNSLPQLSSTNLGPGRNKLFIRGVADSSFNGSSQATISQYLGETRLIYSAPDPDIALYDMAQVQVMEGPQGTLYGAGSLGGIIRLVPNAPDMQDWGADVSAGVRTTQSGALGGDGAIVGNVPLITGKLALRAVAYESIDGGYIDDTLRGLKDINRNKTSGLRADLRWKPATDWTADLSLLTQDINSRDGQYTLTGEPDLTRRSTIAQPFDNDYRLAALTVRHGGPGVQFVTATGYADHAIADTFDATPQTPGAVPTQFVENTDVRLLSHESRISGGWAASGTWLAGVSLTDSDNRTVRRLGTPGSPAPLTSLFNTTLDMAAFGEAGIPLVRHVMLTLGGRFSYVRQTSRFTADVAATRFEPVRDQTRVLPSAALSWTPGEGLIAFARYQEGYRPGALQVTGSEASRTAERFAADRIRTMEAGLRFGTGPRSRLSGSLVTSLALWHSVQADLVGADGLPYIANIGSGRIGNIAASLAWHPRDFLSIEASGFLNSSDLTHPAPALANVPDPDLPNVADEGWRVAANFDRQLPWARLTLDAAVRHVGYSTLAIQAPLELAQGRYYDMSAGARLGFGKWGLALDIENALDTRANTFSYGNPFSVADGNQQTPMRPRTIRIGIDASF